MSGLSVWQLLLSVWFTVRFDMYSISWHLIDTGTADHPQRKLTLRTCHGTRMLMGIDIAGLVAKLPLGLAQLQIPWPHSELALDLLYLQSLHHHLLPTKSRQMLVVATEMISHLPTWDALVLAHDGATVAHSMVPTHIL
jgi:hypothetical protein